jgi:abequosyltransferase
MIESPLLSIAIPTYNRAEFLSKNLSQLQSELKTIQNDLVEILVSDNCSSDNTTEVINTFKNSGLEIQYFKNENNQGWGANFFQCFDFSNGKYVWLLGDDDLIVDGTLKLVIERISNKEFGLVCIRPYGFDNDYKKEFPGNYGSIIEFNDPNRFLKEIGPLMTMISACIVNKESINNIDTKSLFCGNLAHLNLVLSSTLKCSNNLFINKSYVGCKRNNSSNYNFSKVFVEEFWGILESFKSKGLKSETISSLGNSMLFSYYPHYLLLMRINGYWGTVEETLERFSARFGQNRLYLYWLAPIFKLPKYIGILWGIFTVIVGRILGGDFRRGLMYLLNSIKY